MSEVDRYPVEVFWSDEDEGFISVAPDLPGCSAWGADQKEALDELQIAISAWIEAAKLAGNPIPRPSVPSQEFSGKFLVRVPRKLHQELSVAAKQQSCSLNQYVVYLLAGNHVACMASKFATYTVFKSQTRPIVQETDPFGWVVSRHIADAPMVALSGNRKVIATHPADNRLGLTTLIFEEARRA